MDTRLIRGSAVLLLMGFGLVAAVWPKNRGVREEVDIVREETLSEIIEQERQRYSLPVGAIEAVIMQESGYDEYAKNPEENLCRKKKWPKSSCASYGLMGVVYGWHKENCGLSNHKQLYNWKTNVRCGAKVLAQKFAQAKSHLPTAFSFYNGDKTGKYSRSAMSWYRRFSRNG